MVKHSRAGDEQGVGSRSTSIGSGTPPRFHSARGFKRSAKSVNRSPHGPKAVLSDDCSRGSTLLQVRYKVLSWILNYTQSGSRLEGSETHKRGISHSRTFFLTAELMDRALRIVFAQKPAASHSYDLPWYKGPKVKGYLEMSTWCLGLAAFNLSIKIEENRDRFDYYDLMDLVTKEGHPPGIKGRVSRVEWAQHLVECENHLIALMDWQISETYLTTPLGQFEVLMNQLKIQEDTSSLRIKRTELCILVLQLSTLLLPDWVIEGVGSSCPTEIINGLRAYAAHSLSLHFFLVTSDGVISEDPQVATSSVELRLLAEMGPPDHARKALSHLESLLQGVSGIGQGVLHEALTKTGAIQEHMKALMEYLTEFSVLMENKGAVELYRNMKKSTQTPISTRAIHSLLMPAVSSNRTILQDLAVCCSHPTYPVPTAQERAAASSWIQQTFRSSLGYTIRCSSCAEFGHNKRACFLQS